MFGALSDKFQDLFGRLRKEKTLNEDNISVAVRQVRLALLDADVNYAVAKKIIQRIKEQSLGEKVTKSVSASDQFIKVVHDALEEIMGEEVPLVLNGHPASIMLCGLQGSGKTTTAAKLANHLKSQGKEVLLVACDLQRPAAVKQLQVLGEQIGVSVFTGDAKRPQDVARDAASFARKESIDVVIYDTAGRLHVDQELMKELKEIKSAVKPGEVLFVASANLGQDAVNTALSFDQEIEITGSILTMLDGNARAGSAISIREVTHKPLKFEGVGEKIEDLQPFNAHSMADRILGMGDVINLVRKAEVHMDEKESKRLEKKLLKAQFSYDDYLSHMGRIKKMGPLKGLMKMMPGMSKLGDLDLAEGEFKKLEAMILSMTPRERYCADDLITPRRRRVAKGSGTSLDDVNRMCKGFKQIRQMMKGMKGMKGMQKQLLKSGGMDELMSQFKR